MRPIVGKSRTAVIYGVKDARVIERDVPELGTHDALIKVEACNLCTSEYGVFSGARASTKKLPMTFGHEWAGEVIQVGDEVRNLKVGDFVAGSYTFDPYSPEALEGHQFGAPGIRAYDDQWPDGLYGRYVGCAEYLVQSVENLHVFKNRIPASEAGFLEPLSTVVSGIRRLDLKDTDTVVVVGGGTMGNLNAQVARRSGARVIVSEPMADKRAVAEGLGLETIDSGTLDPVEEVKARTDGRGADVVIVAVGLTVANKQAFDMLKKTEGKVLLFAAGYPAPELGVGSNRIHYGKMSVLGTFGGEYVDFKEACRLLDGGLVNVAPLVDKAYPLDEIQAAFENACAPGGYRTTVTMR